MSGPKTSRYTLTSVQRRRLAEQRMTMQINAIVLERIRRNNKKLLQIGGMFLTEKQVSGELADRIGDDGGFFDKMKEMENLISSVVSVMAETNNDDGAALQSTSKTVADSLAKAEKLAAALSQISAQNEAKLQACLGSDIDKGFESSFAGMESAPQTTINERKEKAIGQLMEMKNNNNLSAELAGEVENAIKKLNVMEEETFLKNFFSVSVTPLLKRCKNYLHEFEVCHEAFELLYEEYLAVCKLYDYAVQDYPCCTASMEVLKNEIRRIKEAAAEDDEQGYISNCLDEVMEDMGYTVIGSREVTKKNGKHFRNELYAYGQGAAVSVTYSSDGRIAMELGGMDDFDRFPDDHETSVLCESMEQFCEDFKEIEKRLLARGVVLADRISLLPPGAEYAQIINTSDYQMFEKADKLQTKKQRRAAAKQTAMRKE